MTLHEANGYINRLLDARPAADYLAREKIDGLIWQFHLWKKGREIWLDQEEESYQDSAT